MPLSWNEIKSRAMAFAREWQDAAHERQQSIPFWIAFFEVFGITNKRVASFEHAVKKYGGDQGFIDLFWPGQMLVEQKSRGKPLEPAFDQALSYFPGIAERDLPHTLVVCDFAHFRVIDLATRREITFALADLHKHVRWFGFIAGYRVQEITPQNPVNIKAAERMGHLHDQLKRAGYAGHALEVLLVRLLFCLFADDTGIFQPAQSFRDWVEERTAPDGSDCGARLAQLFQVLDTPEPRRSTNLDEQLATFPYINGQLFTELLPMADFDAAAREALLDASALDWSAISPAIFGSLFQSIMNAAERRHLGAHYTSEENILKLIRPLFLDELRAEFEKVKNHRNRLFDFHKKLRTLHFLDPACGCGNFLVISYRELRLLELDVLRAAAVLQGASGQRSIDVHQLIGVNVDQFCGIEIEEFPAQIARLALWLVDHQMNLKTGEEFGQYFARIPLVTSPRIVNGNALVLDWNGVLPAAHCSYVLGNPPFIGQHLQTAEQKAQMLECFGDAKAVGVLDFVTAWYVKASDYIAGSEIRVAFVSTNSITQGEQVGILWRALLGRRRLFIHFAHRTFRWANEARGKASVYCVIIGFGVQDVTQKTVYEYETVDGEPHAVAAQEINPYLIDAPWVLLDNQSNNQFGMPEMMYGSKPTDGGHFLFSEEEKNQFLVEEPGATMFMRPFIGAHEYLHGEKRWVLWLVNAAPSDVKRMPKVMERVQAVDRFRRASKAPTTRAYPYPTLFRQVTQPDTDYVLIPGHTSESRAFIPFGFFPKEVIVGNSCFSLPQATLFHFGVIQSTMHMAWVRYTCGRLESRYRYSKDIVYNNFPWPFCAAGAEADAAQRDKARAAIEQAAQAVLDARVGFPGSSLADLYDPLTMPPALLKAHQKLDAAVDRAYELAGGPRRYASDAERVAFLFTLYQRITSLLPAAVKPKRARVRKGVVG